MFDLSGRFGIGGNKSSGMVHGKWGSTSFKSMRTVNGISSQKDQVLAQQANNADSGIGVARKREWTSPESLKSANIASAANNVPRPKKFFKSRDTASKPQEQQINAENVSEETLHSSNSRVEIGNYIVTHYIYSLGRGIDNKCIQNSIQLKPY